LAVARMTSGPNATNSVAYLCQEAKSHQFRS
jgi:hypothetical protein